jgi:hypothetical protein
MLAASGDLLRAVAAPGGQLDVAEVLTCGFSLDLPRPAKAIKFSETGSAYLRSDTYLAHKGELLLSFIRSAS